MDKSKEYVYIVHEVNYYDSSCEWMIDDVAFRTVNGAGQFIIDDMCRRIDHHTDCTDGEKDALKQNFVDLVKETLSGEPDKYGGYRCNVDRFKFFYTIERLELKD